MTLTTILLVISLFTLLCCIDAQDDPGAPFNSAKQPSKRVAIIGAGAAGSSAAYHLAQYARGASLPISITVYERSDYVGGRSTTVPVYDNTSLGVSVELGASIFVQVNRILVDAVKEFELSIEGFGSSRARDQEDSADDDERGLLGVWNGEKFVLTQATGSVSWWKDLLMKAKLFWRYGMAPLNTISLMKNITGSFFDMYEEPLFPWRDGLSQVVEDAGLLRATAFTGAQFLEANGIGELFSEEIIQASTRVNYAQNLGLIHGLETMVCMATDGAMSVKGGNYQIFENMLKASSATLRLSTDVFGVQRHANDSYTISSINDAGTSSNHNETFDSVILAAPYHQSDIHFSSSSSPVTEIAEQYIPPDIPYVNLHVTLLASPYRLSPGAFNLDPSAQIPDIILTTLKPAEQSKLGARMDGTNVGSAGFYSLSLLRTVMNHTISPPRREYVYKIFSPSEISDDFLWAILDVRTKSSIPSEGASLESSDYTASEAPSKHPEDTGLLASSNQQKRKPFAILHNTYARLAPVLDPPTTLLRRALSLTNPTPNDQHPLDMGLDPDGKHKPATNASPGTDLDAVTWLRRHTWKSYPYLPPRVTFDEHRLDDVSLWYTSGIESFISTMETSALMGKNVARLLVDEWSSGSS